MWSDAARAQELGRERARLSSELEELDRIGAKLRDGTELLELAELEHDEAAASDIERETGALEADVRRLEFKRQ